MPANQSTRLETKLEATDFLNEDSTHAALTQASNLFIKHISGRTELWAASRDWFMEEWGRDAFISLPGLLLTTQRYDEARQVFRHFAKLEQNGLIPNVIQGNVLAYNASDASLWFMHAFKKFTEATSDLNFAQELMPTLKSIIMNYKHGTTYERNNKVHKIFMDPRDGLIVSPAQSTWMDADPSSNGTTIVTPRNGKCVEINALWYEALNFYGQLVKNLSSKDDQASSEVVDLIRESFATKFWNRQAGYLNDVIEGDTKGDSLRPNQIIALAYASDLIPIERSTQAINIVKEKLLTPGGLRSLSNDDPDYIGSYDTTEPIAVKDLAYHQGSVWPWLIGSYCDALKEIRTRQDKAQIDIRNEIGQTIAPLVKFCLDSEFRSLPELFSGDPPFEPGGTTSQAWSIAEVLRILTIWY